ncbi:MAG TPA: HAD-IA family hydrolase [Candidatus Acidoferrales bacterium]|nr:HAD-IA family hydrolase [Candidatus Acidoferrales bacterium]
MKSNRNRCVTFDLWETLIFDDPRNDETRGRRRYEGLQSVLTDHGVNLESENLRRAYEESASKLQAVWNRNEEVPIIEQIQLIVELANGGATTLDPSWNRSLEEAYVDPILSIPPKLNPDGPVALEAVRNRGYKIGLISNTGRSPGSALRQLLDSYGILRYFDATVFSNEVMRRKPDRMIFDYAARVLGTTNEEVVHVGDNPEADFWGAKNAGMHAILLDQTPPNSSDWPPHSLFALARANMRRSRSKVEARWRIEALVKAPDLVDSLFVGAS